jgi:hypothetical protein
MLNNLVDRIEYCVGNQVICTINDIQFMGTSGGCLNVTIASDESLEYATYNLNLFKDMGWGGYAPNQAYLMACANNQTLQVKVYPKNLSLEEFITFRGNASGFPPELFDANESPLTTNDFNYHDATSNRDTIKYSGEL